MNCSWYHRYLAGLKLTDGAAHVTDYSNAARTMLYKYQGTQWDEIWKSLTFQRPCFQKFVLTQKSMVRLVHSISTVEKFHPGMAGDQQAALFGQLALGTLVWSRILYGTGSFIIMNTGEEMQLSENNL